MALTVRPTIWIGAGPTGEPADISVTFGADEDRDSGSPVLRPPAVGTVYSTPKVFSLEVTEASGDDITDRRVRMSDTPPAGISLFYRVDTTYVRGVEPPPPAETNGATPTGYAPLTTTSTMYDSDTLVANPGRNGKYISVVVGVSNQYVGGANAELDIPDIIMTYRVV